MPYVNAHVLDRRIVESEISHARRQTLAVDALGDVVLHCSIVRKHYAKMRPRRHHQSAAVERGWARRTKYIGLPQLVQEVRL
jgi:hypothetical protein